jgi:RAB protein geranylgeranyltransferase component A
MEEEAIPLDKLVKIYRKLRSRMTELTQEYDTKTEVLKAQQEEIKHAIKDRMKAIGVTSVRTPEGTVVMSVKTVYDTQDWDSFKKFIIEHDAVDLLHKRIAQLNMAQFLEENPGVVPPGLNSSSEYDISVRKPT